jgi:hypothetical protein
MATSYASALGGLTDPFESFGRSRFGAHYCLFSGAKHSCYGVSPLNVGLDLLTVSVGDHCENTVFAMHQFPVGKPFGGTEVGSAPDAGFDLRHPFESNPIAGVVKGFDAFGSVGVAHPDPHRPLLHSGFDCGVPGAVDPVAHQRDGIGTGGRRIGAARGIGASKALGEDPLRFGVFQLGEVRPERGFADLQGGRGFQFLAIVGLQYGSQERITLQEGSMGGKKAFHRSFGRQLGIDEATRRHPTCFLARHLLTAFLGVESLAFLVELGIYARIEALNKKRHGFW